MCCEKAGPRPPVIHWPQRLACIGCRANPTAGERAAAHEWGRASGGSRLRESERRVTSAGDVVLNACKGRVLTLVAAAGEWSCATSWRASYTTPRTGSRIQRPHQPAVTYRFTASRRPTGFAGQGNARFAVAGVRGKDADTAGAGRGGGRGVGGDHVTAAQEWLDGGEGESAGAEELERRLEALRKRLEAL